MLNQGRRDLFPEIRPYRTGALAVSDLHRIYFEECGNPEGKPVVMVHGGPGGGSNPTMRRFHDPARYRIILFDQRGCGRSTPYASLEDNTTWHLIADMEALRVHLGIERWQLCGGSWGSTLALAYAQAHPERVTELILRGIFLLRRAELEWFYQEGCSWIYPDAFEDYLRPIPPEERGDMIAAYHRRLIGPDPAVQLEAARAWSVWEGTTLSLLQDPGRVSRFNEDSYALAFARIEAHYFVNKGFFERDDQLLRDVSKIRHLPGVIIHGRYDVVTPMRNAWDLKQAWPEADLRMVQIAGHAMTEFAIVHEIVEAGDRFASMQG
ncbi:MULTISPECIES: prolyl aminopeptidase [Rhodomicrobium]|uniref:prolyl aminopeptidase n=1 Tax=Rhodomicrobium TaxID=1068 RepID=UPI000B4B504E|nr:MULTISPECIES: prolyl aminopeptidase [Rhodomicrobium]